MIIYSITNKITGQMYIGQTVRSLDLRIAEHHKNMIAKLDFKLYHAMNQYGWDNFVFATIDHADTQEELDALEIYYIGKYDTINSGYNMALGGHLNPMDSEAVVKKHSDKMRSPEVRNKISTSMKQSYAVRGGASEDHKKHLSENKKAHYASAAGEETKAKFRASFCMSDAHKEALNQSHYKSLYCIDSTGKEVATFTSVKEAAIWWYDQGYHLKSIRSICDSIKRSSKKDQFIRGLKWIYRV